MSEQNPSAEPVPEVPSAPTLSTGAPAATEATGGSPVPAQPTGADPQPAATLGSPPAVPPVADPPDVTAPAEPVPAPAVDEPAVKPRRRGGGLLLTAVILAIILVAAGGYYYFVFRTSPARANVGDCLSGTENPQEVANIKLVGCGDSSATFKVTQKITNQPKDTNDSACAGIDHDDVYWYGHDGQNGTILCLLKLNG